MAENSKIEWTHHTFNPWTGCQKVSPACDNCYAEQWAKQYGKDFSAPTRTSASNWKQPLKWYRQAAAAGERQRVFCASLSDVFDNRAPREWRQDLWALIAATPHLDWLLLTKRIGNVADMVPATWMHGAWPKNVWLGITVCNQVEADRDIPKLLNVPAPVRFLSIEPMLGPVDLTKTPLFVDPDFARAPFLDVLRGGGGDTTTPWRINWVIVGGESGKNARPMHPDWVRSLRDQCKAAQVPFMFKQWGEWLPSLQFGDVPKLMEKLEAFGDQWRNAVLDEDANEWIYDLDDEECNGDESWACRVGKKAAGRLLDGVLHDEYPETLRKS